MLCRTQRSDNQWSPFTYSNFNCGQAFRISTSRKDAWQAFDNGIATQTLCLAANDLGLGTVVMGLYDIDKASDIIGVPEGQLLMALVAVGYPDEKPSVPKKKTVEDLLSYC